jgi:hypothetical protein
MQTIRQARERIRRQAAGEGAVEHSQRDAVLKQSQTRPTGHRDHQKA